MPSQKSSKTKNSRNQLTTSTPLKKSKSRRNGFVFSLVGVHGVGKTTVYSLLQSMFEDYTNIHFYPERMSTNPPFPFGSHDKNIAFRSELHYNQQMLSRNQLVKQNIENKREAIVILDRSPLCTLVYSRALDLSKKDYDLIQDTVNSTDWVEEHIIYLESDPNIVMNRIIQRGSLDPERSKWNEEDLKYLKRIMHEYDKLFSELKIEEKHHLDRINTDNLTPKDVAEKILDIVKSKTGIQLNKPIHLPNNQKKLTEWV